MESRTPRSRYRSSTNTSSTPVHDSPVGALPLTLSRLKNHGDFSSGGLADAQRALAQVTAQVDDVSTPNPTQDNFRRSRGFQTLLGLLRSAFSAASTPSVDRDRVLFAACTEVIEVFSRALRDHHGNHRYFANCVPGGGWENLQELCQLLIHRLVTSPSDEEDAEPLATLIVALAKLSINQSSQSQSQVLRAAEDTAIEPQPGSEKDDATQTPSDTQLNGQDHPIQAEKQIYRARAFVKQKLPGDYEVCHSKAVCILAAIYTGVRGRGIKSDTDFPVALRILAIIERFVQSSAYNANAVHGSGILTFILPCLAKTPENTEEMGLLNSICQSLLGLGFDRLTDAAELFKQAANGQEARSMLLATIRKSKEPAHIQFDISGGGHSSIELPVLPHSFPPGSGYSLTAWIRVDQFDPGSHTTLFGAFDATQTCFVLVYIEKDTHQLILQTSVTSSRPSVRFKRTRFKAAEWYHVAIVHRPSRSNHLSQAGLYINGRFVEEVHSQYPQSPPVLLDTRESNIPPQIIGSKRRPVQAFFGTPQDLASQPTDVAGQSRWSLAHAYLYDTCLSLDMIAVQGAIGPRYSGNYQDCIGAFLTYRASAELNRYNEMLYKDKSDKSDIVRTTQQHGKELLPESRLLISISAANVVDADGTLGSSLNIVSMLGEKATHSFHALARNGNSFVLNSAQPLANEAISRPHGAAVITGEPVIHLAHPLDNALWQIGGCLPIVMRLLQNANTDDAITTSVEILFECIQDNWRTSEAMEKGDGFGVLAVLLREKLGLGNTTPGPRRLSQSRRSPQQRDALALQLLKIILRFVGYDSVHPEKSLLINPMAYRILLVDFDTWRTVSSGCQKLYYQQIADFIWKNNHQSFNMKRFNRNRIVRKLLDALKVDGVTSEVLPHILHALKSICLCRSSHLNHREIATFITFALHDDQALSRGSPSMAKVVRSISIRGPRASTPDSPTRTKDEPPMPTLSKIDIGSRVLEMYSQVLCAFDNASLIKKFELHVPPRWLLQLVCEPYSRVVAAALTIMSRCLVDIHGFKSKLLDKNAGFAILQSRLRAQWASPQVWMSCFAIFFGRPFVSNEPMGDLTLFHLIEVFAQHEEPQVHNPEIFPAIAGMLEAGLRSLVSERGEHGSVPAGIPKTVIQFLADVHTRSQSFRNFAVSSVYVQELLFVLFPVIASSDRLNAAAELASDGPLNFQGKDVMLRPHSNSLGERPTVLRSGSSKTMPEQSRKPVQAPRRTSSFVFVHTSENVQSPALAKFSAVMSPTRRTQFKIKVENSVVESLLEVITSVFIDQICQRKDFSGFGLFLKVPPGFQEHQAYFESYVLLHVTNQLWSYLQLNQKLLVEPRVLTNLAKYSLHMAEAVFEGWFIDGAQPLLDFIGKILDYLQQPAIASTKAVRLCNQAVTTLRSVFLRVTLLRLSELDENDDDQESLTFISKMNYWQTILFSPENQELPFIRLICYLLYMKLVSPSRPVRLAAASLWRMLLVQKPTEAATILVQNTDPGQRHLSTGLIKLAAHDDEELLQWIDQNRRPLDEFFQETLATKWEEFVTSENQKTEETARNRLAKRKEKLKQWQMIEAEIDNVLHHHERAARHSRANIYAQERLKYQGIVQDQQENMSHLHTVIARFETQVRQPSGLWPYGGPLKWQLDQTEARNRMRMRIVPDNKRTQETYQSKRKASERLLENRLQVGTTSPNIGTSGLASPISISTPTQYLEEPTDPNEETRSRSTSLTASGLLDGEFEMVDDPRDDEEGYEDKNRKVLKSLRRGDRVQNICNVSRILGLEAFEGLMIIGKKCLYLQDALFQRSDGEIVSVSQAPLEERDPYVQMISGKEIKSHRAQQRADREPARHWTWQELLSLSKRRFLFRDVALEVFFTDGRSYLLTFMTPKTRDDVYSYLMKKAPHMQGDISSLPAEDAWRLDTLRNPEETPQSFGSKLTNVFASTHANVATRKWMRGEISNFQYLMLVNTMAGRTFNDLTQYPIFPWVLADYTSDELDLTDPRSFRDLSKPMGCQHPSRESDFRERYRSFAEMGDEDSPAFHYGTHYSTAMIVSSYLIRLPPFVQSYLVLQGGSFDHADRLFDSIERAWLSASKENMTDVRELTPEFFYLPEFLQNINGYEFGQKQGSNEVVNDVQLPSWAKNDPHIFIAKHREALESPYVSQHLQEWIDLIFGYKQRGEAALEATNVFHHLSYQGAKNLDAMQDSHEKLATISFIHNFGQTPHQVFTRAHPRKSDDEKIHVARLDSVAESLVRIPFPVHEGHERAASLTWSTTQDRLLTSSPCRMTLPPACKIYAQWGYSDNSLRFFSTSESRGSRQQIALYEGTHVGPISTLLFADSKTLITGGADATIGVWNVNTPASGDTIEVTSKTYLFGHRTPISMLAISRAFSTLLSVSTDGHVLLWDLNRFDCVRVLQHPPPLLSTDASAVPKPHPISAAKISNLTGHIALCSADSVKVFTLNGHLLVEQRVCDPSDSDDEVTACAFYEGERGEWVERTLLFTGHKRGVVNVWNLVTLRDGAWYLQLVKRMNNNEGNNNNIGLRDRAAAAAAAAAAGGEDGVVPHSPVVSSSAAVTSILPLAQSVYVGDEEGRVYEWSCVLKESSRGFGGWRV
ncbi:hypothetical protein AAFC00_007008 [Neodothiora populina]|uniref:Beach-domain-containing protein n=1 Tax=Neodothiora populina TaxID=2781224 RepID=A0ABR3PC61_9PEZI